MKEIINDLYQIIGARGCVGLCLYNRIHNIKESNPSAGQKNIKIVVITYYHLHPNRFLCINQYPNDS